MDRRKFLQSLIVLGTGSALPAFAVNKMAPVGAPETQLFDGVVDGEPYLAGLSGDALRIPVGSQLCLITDPAHCLLLIRPEIWAPIRDKVLDLTSCHPRFYQLRRLLIGNYSEVSVDTRHWLELPAEHAKFAQLRKNAYWVQKDRLIELWNPDLYAQGDGSSWLGRQLDK